MDRDKIHSMFKEIQTEMQHGTSSHWIIRAIQGFTPKHDKAPWWMELAKEPALNVVEELRTALKKEQSTLERALKTLDKIEREIKRNEK